jgi:cytoskeletal protein CcmA (bactofilin family)
LNVTGESWLQGAVTAGALNVTGASLLQLGVSAGSLNITGESWLQGAVTAGALNVTGASLLQLGLTGGSLNITGESWLQGAVTAGALNVTGATLLQLGLTAGSLNITGESWLQGAVTAGALNVTGDSILENDLTVTTGSVTISTNDYSPIIDATSASGGSIIFNTVDVSPSLGDISRERIYNTANAQAVAANITGFLFSNSVVRAFDAVVSVTVLTDNNTHKYAYYNLKGVQKSGNWVVNSSYVGDATGYTFSITNAGQIQYTSTNIANYTSSYVSFRALTTSIQM